MLRIRTIPFVRYSEEEISLTTRTTQTAATPESVLLAKLNVRCTNKRALSFLQDCAMLKYKFSFFIF